MNQTFIDNLIIAGIAIISYAGEQYHILPAGTANIVIALVGGAVIGQARAITNAAQPVTPTTAVQQIESSVATTPEKG